VFIYEEITCEGCTARGLARKVVPTTKRLRPCGAAFLDNRIGGDLTLTGFEALLRFVDHVNAAFATHNAAVTVPVLERAE